MKALTTIAFVIVSASVLFGQSKNYRSLSKAKEIQRADTLPLFYQSNTNFKFQIAGAEIENGNFFIELRKHTDSIVIKNLTTGNSNDVLNFNWAIVKSAELFKGTRSINTKEFKSLLYQLKPKDKVYVENIIDVHGNKYNLKIIATVY